MSDLVERLRRDATASQFLRFGDLYQLLCDERREAASRIEADEALMRQALEAMRVNATWPFPKKREEAITALRTRLEKTP